MGQIQVIFVTPWASSFCLYEYLLQKNLAFSYKKMEEYLLVTHMYYVRDLQLNKVDTGSASRASNENSRRKPSSGRPLRLIKSSDVKNIEILYRFILGVCFVKDSSVIRQHAYEQSRYIHVSAVSCQAICT